MAIREEGIHTVYGLNYNEDAKGYRVSSDGYEQKEVENPMKYIAALGDSFTYGRGVKYADIYMTRLRRRLNQDVKKIEVKNYGRVNANIQDILNIYLRESAELPQGSVVIYGFVLNDFGLKYSTPIKGLDFIDINNGGNKFNVLRNRSAFINLIFHCIEIRQLHTYTIDAYLNSFEGQNAEEGFTVLRQLNQSILSDGNIPLLVLFPLLYDFENYKFKSVHEKIEIFCADNQILFLDLLPAFSKYKAKELWANYTDHHPNEIAHRIAADEIYRFIKNKLTVKFSGGVIQ